MIRIRYSYDRDHSFDICVAGKFNIIDGDSGTGKTYLKPFIERLYDMMYNGERVECPIPIVVGNHQVEGAALAQRGSVIVIDENFPMDRLSALLPAMKRSLNYYIVCCREGHPGIPYGLDTTFHLHHKGGHFEMVPAYNTDLLTRNVRGCSRVITEDRCTGYYYIKNICGSHMTVSASPTGKSGLVKLLHENSSRTVVLFDSCGIGNNFHKLLIAAQEENAVLFATRSFEEELLRQGFPKQYVTFDIEKHVRYASEESYYTATLGSVLQMLPNLGYSKSSEEIASLLSTGCGTVNKKYYNLRELAFKLDQPYSELRER